MLADFITEVIPPPPRKIGHFYWKTQYLCWKTLEFWYRGSWKTVLASV